MSLVAKIHPVPGSYYMEPQSCSSNFFFWQEIKAMVVTEQEEFQKFVYNHAKVNHYLFNFIHPDVWDTLKVN